MGYATILTSLRAKERQQSHRLIFVYGCFHEFNNNGHLSVVTSLQTQYPANICVPHPKCQRGRKRRNFWEGCCWSWTASWLSAGAVLHAPSVTDTPDLQPLGQQTPDAAFEYLSYQRHDLLKFIFRFKALSFIFEYKIRPIKKQATE